MSLVSVINVVPFMKAFKTQREAVHSTYKTVIYCHRADNLMSGRLDIQHTVGPPLWSTGHRPWL
jgi:hypothetical protein